MNLGWIHDGARPHHCAIAADMARYYHLSLTNEYSLIDQSNCCQEDFIPDEHLSGHDCLRLAWPANERHWPSARRCNHRPLKVPNSKNDTLYVPRQHATLIHPGLFVGELCQWCATVAADTFVVWNGCEFRRRAANQINNSAHVIKPKESLNNGLATHKDHHI
jgi:hypothetical protein